MAIVTKATPETWKKITFYYNHVLDSDDTTLSTVNATGVDNIYDRDESTIWQVDAAQTTAEIVSYDLSNTITCDYLALGWHNLGTLGAKLSFAYSTDGAAYTDVITDLVISGDVPVIKEFTSQSKEYWRLSLTFDSGDRPQIAYCIWGEKTELDFSTVGFEPNIRTIKDWRSVNQKGYLNKITSQYTERRCRININEVESDVYINALDWHETIKGNNFFIGWENQAHESDAFIMRSADRKLYAPFVKNGYRNINLNLIGHV
jgi:hypothetical protein